MPEVLFVAWLVLMVLVVVGFGVAGSVRMTRRVMNENPMRPVVGGALLGFAGGTLFGFFAASVLTWAGFFIVSALGLVNV